MKRIKEVMKGDMDTCKEELKLVLDFMATKELLEEYLEYRENYHKERYEIK